MAVPGINETLITSTFPTLSPLFSVIHQLIASLQFLVGGIFGLYIILIYLKWRESRMLVKVMKEVRDDIRTLSTDIKILTKDIDKVNQKVEKVKK